MPQKTTTWITEGHEGIKSLLDLQMASGNLPHAYFFCGPEGVGKKTLAEEFAGRLLGHTHAAASGEYVFFQCADTPEAEAVRQFGFSLAMKPGNTGRRVAIIDNIQLLNHFAQNSLLKTLEEPAAGLVIILVGSAGLLPTLLSRCQQIRFGNLNNTNLEKIARQKKWNIDPGVLNLAAGSASRLEKLTHNPAALKESKQRLEKFEELCQQGQAERLSAVAEFSELEQNELLDFFSDCQKDQIRLLEAQPAKVARRVSLLENARRQLSHTSKNKKFVLQNLFTKI